MDDYKLNKMWEELQELKTTPQWKMMEEFNRRLEAKEKIRHEFLRRKYMKDKALRVDTKFKLLQERGYNG